MPVDRTLIKSQKNEVFAEFLEHGVDTKEFEWKSRVSGNDKISVLFHRPTELYFEFDTGFCRWMPTERGRYEAAALSSEWKEHLRKWLALMKREVDEADLWESTKQERLTSQAATATATDNGLFSVAEQKFIAEQLKAIEDDVAKKHNLLPGQIEALQTAFRYLSEASTRMGKKDWINLAIGTVVNVAVGAAFSPGAANGLLHMVHEAFHALIFSAAKLIG
jgi:hypothetical protein